MNLSTNEIIKTVTKLVVWGLALTIGLVVFLTLAEGLIAFASTGLGSIIIILLCWKAYKAYKEMN